MPSRKKIIVVGAGPGGLASALILAARGFDVELFEKADRVGGRNGAYVREGFKFDVGPTFLMMKFLLDEIFEEGGFRSDAFLKFIQLDPMYELRLKEKVFTPRADTHLTKKEIERLFPGKGAGMDRFLKKESQRFQYMIPCIQRDYSYLTQAASWTLIRSLPFLSLHQSVFDVLKGYFRDEELSLFFSFQSKYLGMSAWRCPGAFAMLSYIEHAFGIYHTIGGLSEISESLAKAARERGAKIHLSEPVRELLIEGRDVVGVHLLSGEKRYSDDVVLNADFGYAMSTLVPPGILKKYSPARLGGLKLSCSTLMFHLGLNKQVPLRHHTICFADNYRKNVTEVFEKGVASEDFSFYVRNASVTDPTLAPAGKSSVYILVPVPNLKSGLSWPDLLPRYRAAVLKSIEERLGVEGFEDSIETEICVTPEGWRDQHSVYQGATFNLAHSLDQMAFWRPRNRFEELNRLYLVGGGTHPGSGLPTILESARISANLISKKHNARFITKEVKVSGHV